jgi:hypothetical protein
MRSAMLSAGYRLGPHGLPSHSPSVPGGTKLPRLVATLALVLGLASSVRFVSAQGPDGATMTVLAGQVAVIHSDGSAIQPAPSGTTVYPNDEIRTLDSSGALITFFSGTEIELGEDTVLIVERVSRDGERVDVSLRQVFGIAINRVAVLADSGWSYRIEAGGSVAVGRTPRDGRMFDCVQWPPRPRRLRKSAAEAVRRQG